MATTIKVNGTTITLGNNAVKAAASTESYDFEDVYAKAVESAVMVDVMDMALESMGVMSTEASGFKKNMAKVGNAIKNFWAKIVEFFKNIARSIQSFFMGTGLKMKASAILAKLEKNGGKLPKGFEKHAVSVNITGKKQFEKMIAKFDKLDAIANKVTEASDDKTDEDVALALDAGFAEDVKTPELKKVNLGEVAKAWDLDTAEKVKAFASAVKQNAVAAIKRGLVAKDAAIKNAKTAEAISKKDDKATKKAKRKAYSAKVKLANLELKAYIASVNTDLKIAAAVVGGAGATPKTNAEKAAVGNVQ